MEKNAVFEDSNHLVDDDAYNEDDFIIDASVTLVLAGTSVAALLGQNAYSGGNKTPSPREAYKNIIKDPTPHDVEAFLNIYDALRHLGPSKYDEIGNITKEDLCYYMNTAQNIWQDVLKYRNSNIGEDFQHNFRFLE
jgi:hypothetical protein